MTEELKQAEPKKMGWFRKYVLMQDLRETSDVIVNAFLLFNIGATLLVSIIVIFSLNSQFNINTDKLKKITTMLHTYVYSGKKELIGVWYVEKDGSRVDYYKQFYGIKRGGIAAFEQLNGELVEIQYIPEDSKFYLVQFINPTYKDQTESKRTLAKLKSQHQNNTYRAPILSIFSTLIFIIIEMLIIRYEVFRKADNYFISQPWVVARPVILRDVGPILFGLFLLLVNIFIISELFMRG